MTIELLQTLPDGGQEVLCSVRVRQGAIVVEGMTEADAAALLAEWNEGSILGDDGTPVFPTELDRFLRALPEHYTGSYLRARMAG